MPGALLVLLLHGLEALLDDIVADDQANDRHGRDRNTFEYFDSGLAWIADGLRDRLGVPWSQTTSF